MTSLQIDAVASPVEGATLAEDVHQPSNIKIRFKKGAVFAKSGDESAAVDVMAAQLLIKLSPGSETKRKAAEDMGENDEHVMKRTKTEESGEAMKSIATDSISHTSQTATSAVTPTSPTSSVAATAVSTPCKKAPTKPASIFRKLAKKLATQPLLLDHLKEYRTSINAQSREDAKTIASLHAQLSAAKKSATEKELRAAEELKASHEMVQFWTDSCNDEFEGAMLLKEKIYDLIDKVEVMGKAEAIGDAAAGFGKGMQIEFELQKLGAEMKNMVAEVVPGARN